MSRTSRADVEAAVMRLRLRAAGVMGVDAPGPELVLDVEGGARGRLARPTRDKPGNIDGYVGARYGFSDLEDKLDYAADVLDWLWGVKERERDEVERKVEGGGRRTSLRSIRSPRSIGWWEACEVVDEPFAIIRSWGDFRSRDEADDMLDAMAKGELPL